ncbi:MAG: exodeoxyribonuclease VII large subunit [Mesorhizobium amorphae]|nr:MAG: exodeoxyribonuclease VII large subunit [Mesorhizobium amorphae]
MSETASSPSRGAPTNASDYSVSELSGALKRTVEDAFGNVRVRGEISGYRGPHSSGHAYFALKDERARLEAVIWKGSMGRLRFRPEEGMEVIASGKLTTYPGSSKYQIVIEQLEPAGAGALMALLEERKRKLAAEGLFERDRKRPLPFLPRVIGVVTSPTGAVIRDILHRLADRYPLHVMVWPVRVQGETSGAEAAAAVRGFNALPEGFARPDLLIVARGGGSLEDLWGFNDEALVRAVGASLIPVISAVGHETDWTLIDLVADRRAPTPTGAAEMAVPVRAELEAGLASFGARMRAGLSRLLDRRRQAVRAASRALPVPDQLLALPRRRLDEASSRLERSLGVALQAQRARLGAARLSSTPLKRRVEDAQRGLGRTAARLGNAALRARADKARALRQSAARLSLQPIERRLMEAVRHETRLADRLARAGARDLARRRETLSRAGAGLRLQPLVLAADALRQRLDLSAAALDQNAGASLEDRRTRLAQADRLLSSLSYRSVLGRGFAVVRGEGDHPVTQAGGLAAGQHFTVEFADGRVSAVAGTDAAATPRKRASGKRAAKDQGSLF